MLNLLRLSSNGHPVHSEKNKIKKGLLLHRYAGTEADAFWETYGQAEKGLGVQFRALIYQGGHIGGARLEHHRLHHAETVKRSYQDIQAIIEALGDLPLQHR